MKEFIGNLRSPRGIVSYREYIRRSRTEWLLVQLANIMQNEVSFSTQSKTVFRSNSLIISKISISYCNRLEFSERIWLWIPSVNY